MNEITNKGEQVWLRIFCAALTVRGDDRTRSMLGDDDIARKAAEFADEAFKQARKRIRIGERGQGPPPRSRERVQRIETGNATVLLEMLRAIVHAEDAVRRRATSGCVVAHEIAELERVRSFRIENAASLLALLEAELPPAPQTPRCDHKGIGKVGCAVCDPRARVVPPRPPTTPDIPSALHEENEQNYGSDGSGGW